MVDNIKECPWCEGTSIVNEGSPDPISITEYRKLQSALDLMRDEFRRISALCYCLRGNEPYTEITGLCARAVSNIERTVPVSVECEKAKDQVAKLRDQLAQALEHIQGLVKIVSKKDCETSNAYTHLAR